MTLTSVMTSLKGLLISAPGPFPNLISQTRYGFLRGNDIEVLLVSSLQIPVIAKGKPQKVQRCSLLPHLYNVRLVPIHSKSKVCFQLSLYPSRDTGAYVSSQNQEVIGISNQSGLGRLVRPLRFLMKAFIHCMRIDIGRQVEQHLCGVPLSIFFPLPPCPCSITGHRSHIRISFNTDRSATRCSTIRIKRS